MQRRMAVFIGSAPLSTLTVEQLLGLELGLGLGLELGLGLGLAAVYP